MKKLFLRRSSGFLGNILTLFTGNAIAFILPVVLYPVLSRIFSVEDYALFGLYVGIFSFLEIASAGRYDFGIVLPERDEDAISLVWGGLLISVAYALLIFVVVIFLGDIVANKLRSPPLLDWLFLLPVSLLFISVSKVCNGWLLRAKKFKASSINKASQKFAEVGSQLTFGLLRSGNGLILGDLVGRLFHAMFSIYQSWKAGLGTHRFTIDSIKVNLLLHAELPMYGIFPAMLNNLGGLLPVFIISSFYSSEVTGSFNFSRIVLSVPFALIVTGLSQVIMQQVSEQKNKNQLIYADLRSVAMILLGLSVVATAVLFLLGPELFEFVFGVRWRQAGSYTSVLIFATTVSFVVSPFSIILVVLGRIKLLSYWQIFYFLAISTLWLLNDASIEYFLLILVCIDCFSYLVYGLLIFRAIKTYESGLVRPFA